MTMATITGIRSVELEITGKCQLQCSHCCTNSGPLTPAGAMAREDWLTVIDEIAALGIPAVQLIGGEPTLSPYLADYIDTALKLGLKVEVYSNLTHVRPALWTQFSRAGVSLATSYYSDDAAQHERITGGRGSFACTRASIKEAVRRHIPLRAGIVRVIEGQRVDEAVADLRVIGVERIQVDRKRKVGRAADSGSGSPSTNELCGHCFRHRVAISPDGVVTGCILSRFLPAGNVRKQFLGEILTAARWEEITASIPLPRNGACTPDDSSECDPWGDAGEVTMACPPHDSGDCDPANTIACAPKYSVVPVVISSGAAS